MHSVLALHNPPTTANLPVPPQDGNWSDVSGENFLRTLLTRPVEEISGSFSDEEPMFAVASPVGGDPRGVAQRIMDYRWGGWVGGWVSRWVGSSVGMWVGQLSSSRFLPKKRTCHPKRTCYHAQAGWWAHLIARRGLVWCGCLARPIVVPAGPLGGACRHAIAKEWIEELRAVPEENKVLLSETLMGSLGASLNAAGGRQPPRGRAAGVPRVPLIAEQLDASRGDAGASGNATGRAARKLLCMAAGAGAFRLIQLVYTC